MAEPEFDRHAASYDRLHAENIRITGETPDYFAEYKARHAARLARGALPLPRVLDFGCGIGNATGFLAKHFPGCEITGTDLSPASLEIARKRTGPAATFHAMHGDAIPFADASFGLVFVSCVLHHVASDRHAAVLAEIRRVLAPGAWLIVYEHNPWNPLTVRAVESCELDRHAVLIASGKLRSTIEAAEFREIQSRYIVFFPHVLRFLRWSEPLLAWLPLGAQYGIAARR
jgi:SAM-dependent methyltransferase